VALTHARQEKYAEIDGHRVCFVDEGDGPPLLLIRGPGGSLSNRSPVIEHFKQRHGDIAPDLPGFGKSEIVDGDYSLDFFARRIRGLPASPGTERSCHLASHGPARSARDVQRGGRPFPCRGRSRGRMS